MQANGADQVHTRSGKYNVIDNLINGAIVVKFIINICAQNTGVMGHCMIICVSTRDVMKLVTSSQLLKITHKQAANACVWFDAG